MTSTILNVEKYLFADGHTIYITNNIMILLIKTMRA